MTNENKIMSKEDMDTIVTATQEFLSANIVGANPEDLLKRIQVETSGRYGGRQANESEKLDIQSKATEIQERYQGVELKKADVEQLCQDIGFDSIDRRALEHLTTLERLENLRIERVCFIPRECHNGDHEVGYAKEDFFAIQLSADYTPRSPPEQRGNIGFWSDFRDNLGAKDLATYLGWTGSVNCTQGFELDKEDWVKMHGSNTPYNIGVSGDKCAAKYNQTRRALRDYFSKISVNVKLNGEIK